MMTTATFQYKGQDLKVNLNQPIDISIVLQSGDENPNAWYLNPPEISPVVMGEWVGSVKKGASTNFNNIWFNPHAHGTHTECVGHITEEFYSINDCLKQFYFMAEVVSVSPEQQGEDVLITKEQLEAALTSVPEAIVIRTLPNTNEKLTRQYSHSNPPYMTEAAASYLKDIGVKHLLIDLPSVDKEEDGGALVCHRAFWNVQGNLRLDATITEMIYVPDTVKDGPYVLNLQIASFHNDAAPSKPVLYSIENN